jgi:hypothetical protein
VRRSPFESFPFGYAIGLVIGSHQSTGSRNALARLDHRVDGRIIEQVAVDRSKASPDPARRVLWGEPLLVSCWCERQYVEVAHADVLAGLTDTCGHRHCHPPKNLCSGG